LTFRFRGSCETAWRPADLRGMNTRPSTVFSLYFHAPTLPVCRPDLPASASSLLFLFYAVFKDRISGTSVPENRTVEAANRPRVSGYLFNPACSLERR
jgi:hypothetical protein